MPSSQVQVCLKFHFYPTHWSLWTFLPCVGTVFYSIYSTVPEKIPHTCHCAPVTSGAISSQVMATFCSHLISSRLLPVTLVARDHQPEREYSHHTSQQMPLSELLPPESQLSNIYKPTACASGFDGGWKARPLNMRLGSIKEWSTNELSSQLRSFRRTWQKGSTCASGESIRLCFLHFGRLLV